MRRVALFLVCLVAALPLAAQERATPLVVVELFTSQGCSACPPADALLEELAAQEDVLTLALHIDYWDYLGWKDPHSAPANTARQRDYADALGLRALFTPQAVVQGAHSLIGSRREAMLRAVAQVRGNAHTHAPRLRSEGGWVYLDSANPSTASDPAVETTLFAVSAPAENAVRSGENAGRRLSARRAARILSLQPDGAQLRARLPDDAIEITAIAQLARGGPIIGATRLTLPPRKTVAADVARFDMN